jgi:type IV pilus assembly protein PilX
MNMPHKHLLMTRFGAARQRGLSLVFAMLALATLSLAAAGLVRSTNADSLVAGNIGFKAETAAFAERGTEAAIGWLEARGPDDLLADMTSDGYYATNYTGLDVTGQDARLTNRATIDWDGDGCAKAANFSGGACVATSPEVKDTVREVSYRFVVLRLCTQAGSLDPPNNCVTGLEDIELGDSSRDDYDYGRTNTPPSVSVQQPSYRILVRALGARNTVTFTETIVRK